MESSNLFTSCAAITTRKVQCSYQGIHEHNGAKYCTVHIKSINREKYDQILQEERERNRLKKERREQLEQHKKQLREQRKQELELLDKKKKLEDLTKRSKQLDEQLKKLREERVSPSLQISSNSFRLPSLDLVPPLVTPSVIPSVAPSVTPSVNIDIDLTVEPHDNYESQFQRDLERAIELSLRDYKPPTPKVIENSNIKKVKFVDSCQICKDSFKDSEDINVLICTHMYHKDCIDEWLKRSNTCPLCRHNV